MQKTLIPTALGAFGFGALLGWAVTADICEKRFKLERATNDKIFKDKTNHIWELQDRIEYIKEQIEYSNAPIEVDEVDPAQMELEEEPVLEPQEEFVALVEENEEETIVGETLEETRTNLQRLIDTYTANPDREEEIQQYIDQAVDVGDAPPFVISRDSYAWDEEGDAYSKITLTYYPRERVLLDDDEDPVDDVPRTIGWRNLTQFGGESGDPDVVFVRNRRLQTDFEVVKEEDTRLPLHIQYGMQKEEFRVNKAAGLIKLRREDE